MLLALRSAADASAAVRLGKKNPARVRYAVHQRHVVCRRRCADDLPAHLGLELGRRLGHGRQQVDAGMQRYFSSQLAKLRAIERTLALEIAF